MISKKLEALGSNQSSHFRCPACDGQYTLLEASGFDMNEEGFLCPTCELVIQDITNKTSTAVNADKYSLFMMQIKPIVDLLRKTDDMKLPEIGVADLERIQMSLIQEKRAETRANNAAAKAQKAENGDDANDGVAPTTESNGIVIEIVRDELQTDNLDYSDAYRGIQIDSAETEEASEEDQNESGSNNKRARMEESEEDDEFVDVDDVTLVTVNGEYIPLNMVTDEHKVIMTPEEFEKYQSMLKS